MDDLGDLHRAELTVTQRAEQIAEWIRLTEVKAKPSQVATVSMGGRGKEGGVNAAARELGITKDKAHRAVKIDAIVPPPKTRCGRRLDDNQTGPEGRQLRG